MQVESKSEAYQIHLERLHVVSYSCILRFAYTHITDVIGREVIGCDVAQSFPSLKPSNHPPQSNFHCLLNFLGYKETL